MEDGMMNKGDNSIQRIAKVITFNLSLFLSLYL